MLLIVGIVVDALPQLYDPTCDLRNRPTSHRDHLAGIDQDVAMAIATSSVFGEESSSSSHHQHRDYDSVSRVRNLSLNCMPSKSQHFS